MVNHCELCDTYKKCDLRPPTLLPAVYVKASPQHIPYSWIETWKWNEVTTITQAMLVLSANLGSTKNLQEKQKKPQNNKKTQNKQTNKKTNHHNLKGVRKWSKIFLLWLKELEDGNTWMTNILPTRDTSSKK